jgi:hypothetical protein
MRNLMARLERLEAAMPDGNECLVVIVCYVSPGELETPRKLLGYRSDSPNSEYFPREAGETEERCHDRVVALLKARQRNVMIYEDREE